MYVLETLEIKILENNDFLGVVLMNLSKAFDRIPNDLVIAMLAAYGFDKNMLCYIYSYLKSWKQCVSVNNIKITFKEILSAVPQGSVVGPILFNPLSANPTKWSNTRIVWVCLAIFWGWRLKG